MPFAEIDDARIHYDLSGPAHAPVLMFSNSLGTDFSMWDPQLAQFRNQFQLLRYDTRGHGQSSITSGPYTIEQLARDVIGLLDILHLDAVYFCGLSMGGMTGMWLAVNAPNRLRKLVLCNTAAKIGSPDVWKARIEAVRTGGMKSISSAVMKRWFSANYHASDPEVVTAIKQALEGCDAEGYIANCAAIRDFDAREAIAAIRVPTLVIAGTYDTSTSPADGRFLAERITGARFVELNAAHLSNIEAREPFNAELAGFLLS